MALVCELKYSLSRNVLLIQLDNHALWFPHLLFEYHSILLLRITGTNLFPFSFTFYFFFFGKRVLLCNPYQLGTFFVDWEAGLELRDSLPVSASFGAKIKGMCHHTQPPTYISIHSFQIIFFSQGKAPQYDLIVSQQFIYWRDLIHPQFDELKDVGTFENMLDFGGRVPLRRIKEVFTEPQLVSVCVPAKKKQH